MSLSLFVLHQSDDQISTLRLPLWTSIGNAESSPILQHTNAGDIGASRAGQCRICWH
jgi:hypothetical protein